MKNTTIITMVVLVLIASLTLLMINFLPSHFPEKVDLSKKSLPILDPRGMAVVHNNIPYTLDYEQQNAVVAALSRAVEVTRQDFHRGTMDFEKIIVYRFNEPDLELFPVEYSDQNLIFSVPAIAPNSYFMELTLGELKNLINSSFQ